MQFIDDFAAGLVKRFEFAPQIRPALEQFPLGLLDNRDGVAGRTAHRLAAIEGRTVPATIMAGRNRGAEALIDFGKVFGFGGHARASRYSSFDSKRL